MYVWGLTGKLCLCAGRYFYMCSRPPAAGDEGQCKTFKWASAVQQ